MSWKIVDLVKYIIYNEIMNIITIPQKISKDGDLVIIPRKEYEYMKTRMFPVVYLNSKKAVRLDRRVDRALREYRQGKTKIIKSLADLD